MSTQISVARIVRLGVPVAWHEAVAVAQQVGRVAHQTTNPAGADNCYLSASGEINIVGSTPTPFRAPVAGALGELLDRAKAPGELVALVDRVSGGAPGDLVSELEFFARPDVEAVVGGLASRALAAESEALQFAELERLRAEVTTTKKSAPDTDEGSKRRLRLVPVLALVGIALVASLGVVTLTNQAAVEEAVEAAAPTEPATALPARGITDRIDALVDKGLQTLGLAPAATAPVESAARQTDPQANKSGARSTRARARQMAIVAPPAAAVTPAAGPNADIPAEAGSVIITAVEDIEITEEISEGLEPPVLRWPQLPQEQHYPGESTSSSYLELLVNEGGTVDRVRLHSPRNLFHDRMLVSAAKAWVFHPARQDGRPVKYLMKVPILNP